MNLFLLHLDDALTSQRDFLESCAQYGAQTLEMKKEGAAIRLWGEERSLEVLSSHLRESFIERKGPKLCFMGSGDFHHVTSLLLAITISASADPITVIHFDNHPDWVHFGEGAHCGSWVNRAATHPAIAKIVTIGVASNDLKNPDWKGANIGLIQNGRLELYPYQRATSRVRHSYGQGVSHHQLGQTLHWQTMESMGEEGFIATLLSRIPTRDIYITIDKDVLTQEDAATNWDQGHMRLDSLLTLVRRIGQRHRIVGADVTGDYSTPHYTGPLATRVKKRAEIWLDQPRKLDRAEAARVNSRSNHAILKTLQELMA